MKGQIVAIEYCIDVTYDERSRALQKLIKILGAIHRPALAYSIIAIMTKCNINDYEHILKKALLAVYETPNVQSRTESKLISS